MRTTSTETLRTTINASDPLAARVTVKPFWRMLLPSASRTFPLPATMRKFRYTPFSRTSLAGGLGVSHPSCPGGAGTRRSRLLTLLSGWE